MAFQSVAPVPPDSGWAPLGGRRFNRSRTQGPPEIVWFPTMSSSFRDREEASRRARGVIVTHPNRDKPVVQSTRVVVVVLLVLLMLPIRALGGKTIAGSAPTAGQEYVVRSGDTLASIAEHVGGGNAAGMERQLAGEAGSTVLVPGEHLLIP